MMFIGGRRRINQCCVADREIFSFVFSRFVFIGIAMLLLRMLITMVVAAPTFEDQRGEMILKIEDHFQRLGQFAVRDKGLRLGMLDNAVREVLSQVPRHEFVPKQYQKSAYRDRPLPIGYGQTISQPVIVAVMTQLLDVRSDHKVLEIGTGSGYQAAVLSKLARHVYSIEIVDALGRTAAQTLKRLEYQNVEVRVGDGYLGWPEKAPFDRIIVTAAPDHIPQPLIDQLKPGGRLVIPVGKLEQDLMVIDKGEDGRTQTRRIFSVRFVPLTRD